MRWCFQEYHNKNRKKLFFNVFGVYEPNEAVSLVLPYTFPTKLANLKQKKYKNDVLVVSGIWVAGERFFFALGVSSGNIRVWGCVALENAFRRCPRL